MEKEKGQRGGRRERVKKKWKRVRRICWKNKVGEAIEDADGVRRTKDGNKEMKIRKGREEGRRKEVVEEENEKEQK